MARKDTVWTNKPGRYIQTLSPTGYDVLINGTDRYLNFLDVSGSSGYGFRDNAGTMQFKDSVGSWAAFGSGGGSSNPVNATFTRVGGRISNVLFAGGKNVAITLASGVVASVAVTGIATPYTVTLNRTGGVLTGTTVT